MLTTSNIEVNDFLEAIDKAVTANREIKGDGLSMFMVGSRAYDNCYPGYRASNNESDYDIVISIRYSDIIFNYCRMKYGLQSIKKSNYNNGYKVTLNEFTVINIIPLIQVEYYAWKNASESLIRWASRDNFIRVALQHRTARIGLLEQLRATYKTALSIGSISNDE